MLLNIYIARSYYRDMSTKAHKRKGNEMTMTKTYAKRELAKVRKEINFQLKGHNINDPKDQRALQLLKMRQEMLVSFIYEKENEMKKIEGIVIDGIAINNLVKQDGMYWWNNVYVGNTLEKALREIKEICSDDND